MKTTSDKRDEDLERKQIDKLISKHLIRNINELQEEQLTFGNKVADKLADFAGSWKFIISFLVIIVIWISINSWVILFSPYDPYPFILLNLILSCIAALQAPIIMMSQKRQESKDRIRSEHDFEVDVKTEILVEHLVKELRDIKSQQAAILESIEKANEKIDK
ncbi:MAG: DUF1003 domain-containing protein [Erysipelothrix sp.]|nr:DUF1003 domain-containing protein [Erysipelothrix sp.]